MVTLEQVKLLESKIAKAIGFVNQVTEENTRLKKRNDELEDLAARLRDEKTKVEEGIVSALDRLNQFEDAIERSLTTVKGAQKPAPQTAAKPAAPQPAPAIQSQAVPAASTAPSPSPASPSPAKKIPSAYTVGEDEGPSASGSVKNGDSLDMEVLDEAEDPDETGDRGDAEGSAEAELDIF